MPQAGAVSKEACSANMARKHTAIPAPQTLQRFIQHLYPFCKRSSSSPYLLSSESLLVGDLNDELEVPLSARTPAFVNSLSISSSTSKRLLFRSLKGSNHIRTIICQHFADPRFLNAPFTENSFHNVQHSVCCVWLWNFLTATVALKCSWLFLK